MDTVYDEGMLDMLDQDNDSRFRAMRLRLKQDCVGVGHNVAWMLFTGLNGVTNWQASASFSPRWYYEKQESHHNLFGTDITLLEYIKLITLADPIALTLINSQDLTA